MHRKKIEFMHIYILFDLASFQNYFKSISGTRFHLLAQKMSKNTLGHLGDLLSIFIPCVIKKKLEVCRFIATALKSLS